MTQVSFEDFYQVPDLKFNILKLRDDLDSILKSKNFNSLGISHFGAIPINRIPNDNESVEGHNVRGKYWTIADESGKVVSRDIAIDESKYTELMPEFENTYFKEVYETLRKKFKLGRVRLLLNSHQLHSRFGLYQLIPLKQILLLLIPQVEVGSI